MKNKLLSTAVFVALGAAPALAQAEMVSAAGLQLNIFGILQAELSEIDIENRASITPAPTTTPPANDLAIRDNGIQSRVGFDIKKDLGGGQAAIGRLEYTQVLGNGDGPGAREQWVGLQGGWGEINAGQNQAPMKYIAGAAYDIFVATALQARGSGAAMWAPGAGWGAAGFVTHSIKYRTPKDFPVTLHVLVMPSNSVNSDSGAESGGPGNGIDYNLAGSWGGSQGEIAFGYSSDSANDSQKLRGFDDESVYRIAGKWVLGPVTLFGQYEGIKSALSSGGVGEITTTPALPTGISPNYACTGGSGFRGGDALYPGGVGQCNTAMNPGGDGNIYFVALHYKLGNTVLVLQGGKTSADAVAAPAPVASHEATNATIGAVYFFDKTTRVYGGYQKVTVKESDGTSPDRASIALGMRQDF